VAFAAVSVRCQREEMPRYAIVYPADAPVPERTTALELALHLREATGEWYELIEEGKFEDSKFRSSMCPGRLVEAHTTMATIAPVTASILPTIENGRGARGKQTIDAL